MGNKTCSICKQDKDNTEFYNNKSPCKKCKKIYDAQKSLNFQSVPTHKCNSCGLEYDTNNFHKGSTICKKCKKIYLQSRWIHKSLKDHEKCNIIINTTEIEIKNHIDITHCNICGKSLTHGKNGKTHKGSPTLDRINNEKIININNIQIVCSDCNLMKGNRTMDDFLLYLNIIRKTNFLFKPRLSNKVLPKWSEVYSRKWSHNTINSHKLKGQKILLTIDEIQSLLVQTPKCPICGCKFKYGTGKSCNTSPTLDRINNKSVNIGIDDVWIICHSCNSTKRTFTISEWKEYAKKVCNLWEQRHSGEVISEGYNLSKISNNDGLQPNKPAISDENKALNQGVQATV